MPFWKKSNKLTMKSIKNSLCCVSDSAVRPDVENRQTTLRTSKTVEEKDFNESNTENSTVFSISPRNPNSPQARSMHARDFSMLSTGGPGTILGHLREINTSKLGHSSRVGLYSIKEEGSSRGFQPQSQSNSLRTINTTRTRSLTLTSK